MLIIDDYYTEGTRIVIDYVHQVYAQLFPFSLSNKIIRKLQVQVGHLHGRN